MQGVERGALRREERHGEKEGASERLSYSANPSATWRPGRQRVFLPCPQTDRLPGSELLAQDKGVRLEQDGFRGLGTCSQPVSSHQEKAFKEAYRVTQRFRNGEF